VSQTFRVPGCVPVDERFRVVLSVSATAPLRAAARLIRHLVSVVIESRNPAQPPPEPSGYRIAHNRRTRKSSKEIREVVSDRG
jgi:hypothetical protein